MKNTDIVEHGVQRPKKEKSTAAYGALYGALIGGAIGFVVFFAASSFITFPHKDILLIAATVVGISQGLWAGPLVLLRLEARRSRVRPLRA